MRLGILADIHEQTKHLRKAIAVLQEHGADRFVALGDVFETGKRMEETVSLLQEVRAVGVWGNHDIGLCFDPADKVGERYSAAVLAFMGGLQPRLEIGGCLFTHVEPWLDPHKIEDLWYFDGPPDSAEKLARSFAAVPHRVLFVGHLHRWLLGTPDGLLPWRGDGPVRLEGGQRYLAVGPPRHVRACPEFRLTSRPADYHYGGARGPAPVVGGERAAAPTRSPAMRLKCFLLLAGLALICGPDARLGQLHGESGAAGEVRAPVRNSTDLTARWNQLTGGAAVWRRAALTDPQQQFIFDLVADKLRCANGEIAREQFLGMALRPTAGQPGAAAPVSHGGSAQPKASERHAPPPAAPSPARRTADEDDSRPGPSAEAAFRRCDVNGDGLLSYDEMDEALRAERDKWDANRDGFIDLAEFKAYFKARARQEHAARGTGPRAVVEGRPRKLSWAPAAADLPPNLPAWFRQYDSDGDGQIGLYEWKAAGRSIAEFEAMDFNGDGFLTPDEVLGPAADAAGTKESKESSKNAKEAPKNVVVSPTNDSPTRVFLQSFKLEGGGGLQIRLGK